MTTRLHPRDQLRMSASAQVLLCPRMLTRELKDIIARNEERWTLVM